MARYKCPAFRQLKDQQIHHASRDARVRQMDRAEQLLIELDPKTTYAYADLRRKLVPGYTGEDADVNIKGSTAVHDLRLFVEDLSDSVDLPADAAGEPVLTVQDVSRRFNVSTKTVDRWRERGLASRRFRFGARKRVGFLQSSVERFVAAHPEDVDRGTRFSQMTDGERETIIQRARYLARSGGTPARIARLLSREFGRSAEAIRYTLKNYDQEHPEMAIFPYAFAPLSDETKRELYRSHRRGVPVERLAAEYGRTRTDIERAIAEQRASRLLEQPIEYVFNAEFDAPDADAVILGPAPEDAQRKTTLKAPAGLPPYLAALYRVPLLNQEQEVYYFRKMNYLKYKAGKLRERIDVRKVRPQDLDRIEDLLNQATEVKNLLVRRNLRLVVSIAKRHLRPGFNFFEMVSDGNMSLMRAIEKFDYARGFKLSTYATWAIKRNFARTVPAEYTQLDRFRTGSEELFQGAPNQRSSQFEQERTNQSQREVLVELLGRLQDRERAILATRYGLDQATEPQTLEQVGQRFGVTKERIRQLEKRALNKLREIATKENIDIPGVR